jgi:endonuclease YncB( thermonuclease family)
MVISVADGDTITVLTQQNEQIKVRLSGVDCPEGGQAYGKKAKQFTSSMVYKKIVTIEPETTDRYGRTVAMVLINRSNLSELIIANGYGWVYRKYCTADYCKDWLRLEEKARTGKIGLWADDNPKPPWDYRSEKRNGGGLPVTVLGDAVFYHGNVKSNVFHGPSCRDYNCKNCTVILDSIEEAKRKKFRGHSTCVLMEIR